MTSSLVVQDFQGVHNADTQGTYSRLLKGGSWKKQSIAVIIPSDARIAAKVALSLWNLIFPPNQAVVRILALGLEVGDAYSKAVEQILAHPQLKDFNYVLTIEHDNAPPQDGVLRLLERMEEHPEFSSICGSYFTKGAGGIWMGYGDVRDPIPNFRPQLPQPGKCVEIFGSGMGFCLFRMEMLRDPRLARPLFQTKAGKDGCGTQDLMFFAEARKYGYRAAIDTECKVGHYDLEGKFGPPDTMW